MRKRKLGGPHGEDVLSVCVFHPSETPRLCSSMWRQGPRALTPTSTGHCIYLPAQLPLVAHTRQPCCRRGKHGCCRHVLLGASAVTTAGERNDRWHPDFRARTPVLVRHSYGPAGLLVALTLGYCLIGGGCCNLS